MTIDDLTDTPSKRISEYKLRKKTFIEQNFKSDEDLKAISEGWDFVRENKSAKRYRKERDITENTTNEFWRLLYEFGYPRLNLNRKISFRLKIAKDEARSRDIDILAHDSETIIIAECIATEKRTKSDLQSKITALANDQRKIANELKGYLGSNFGQKIIWIFVTKNIDWTADNKKAAKDNNIRIITEREMFYYKEIARRVGHAARYQFHAEFLSKTKVAALQAIEVSAIRTKIGPHRVYAFFAPAKKILPICFVNHRDLRDPVSAPSYQRLIQKKRLKSISDFVTKGGFFPNSIILNFKQKVVFNPSKTEDSDGVSVGSLVLPNTYKSAWIIDGQHRIYGCADVPDKNNIDLLPFFAFENISILNETKLFSEINSKQRRVEQKLLDEITGEIKLGSSDKREQMRAIASRVFDMMRDDDDGPLGGKITGAEISHSDQSILTIPYLVDAVSSAGLLGRIVKRDSQSTYTKGPLEWEDPTQAIDALIEFLTEYLNLFQRANPSRWDAGRLGKVSTNPGVSAIIRLSADLIAYSTRDDASSSKTNHPKKLVENLEGCVEPCTTYFRDAPDADVDQRFQIPFGSGGPKLFLHHLRELVYSTFPDFDAPGFKDDLRRFDAERTERTDKMIRMIQEEVHGFILGVLKNSQNNSEDYLEKAIDNKEVLTKAFAKRIESDDSERKDLATYLDFVDLKKIVESPKVWPMFSKNLNIKMKDERNGKAKYTTWFDSINKARRVSAHPYNRGYSDDDVRDVEFIFNQLCYLGVIKVGL